MRQTSGINGENTAKWGKYSKMGRHPVRLRKAAEGQHHPLSPALYSSNYP